MAGAALWQRPALWGLAALAIIAATVPPPASAWTLSPSFYANTCPSVLDIVRAGVESAIGREARLGASLIRLFFHDCFVNGCDGSVLLADIGSFVGERTANANNNSIRGFSVIDSIKEEVDSACGAGVVSCADILAIAARDSVKELGGPCYSIPVGRRDARTASRQAANSDLPAPFESLNVILRKFGNKGFTARETVALSGGHTVGFAQCLSFRPHIYNDTNIDPSFAAARRARCPATVGQGDTNLAPMDVSPDTFGNSYFQGLTQRRGLLASDQALYNGGPTDAVVEQYSGDASAFYMDFANAMVKMGNLGLPLTATQGEIRLNCQRIN